jgi:sugar-specific transcriptional regulator TrmB
MILETELRKLGLKDKEAAVYLSCLESGSSPVQNVARKAKVVRATTYVVLEALMQKGLVTRYKEGKKTMFSAEPHRQLMRLLEKERENIDEKQHDLEQLLPELQILMRASGGRPSVRYFAGIEGLRAIRREMVMYSKPGDTWYNFTPMDHLDAVFGRGELLYTHQRVAKKIKGKTIFTTKSKKLRDEILTEANSDNYSERRFVSSDVFPSNSGLTIFRDRVAIGSFTGKVGGVIIDSSDMADMMKSVYKLAWQGATEANITQKK